MLTIICGEDNVSSRQYFLDLLADFRKKSFEIQRITAVELPDAIAQSSQAADLFGMKRIFATENLNRLISRKSSSNLIKLLETAAEDKDIEVVDWEDGVQQRELKLKKVGKVKEFKPATNIFKLLDACYPTNSTSFLRSLNTISTAQTEIFILTMLQRHLRSLMLIATGNPPPTLQSWQLGKLKNQAKFWSKEKLIFFYDGLYKIDSSLKTGKNPYGIKRSLDILAHHYLK